jgi:MoaA/NifB/PqqE/SkfB family radical SAM enzyme
MDDAEKIVSSGLDSLIVALDGANQESYSRYRIGGDIQKIFRCLELVRRAKESLGSRTPLVNVRTVVNRENEPELGDIEEIARKYGANLVTRKSMAICFPSSQESAQSLLPTNPLYLRSRLKDGQMQRRSVDDLRCRRPWNRMTVNAGGVVLSCEFDVDETEAFGQGGNGGSFLEAWRGAQAAEFRRRFLERKSAFPFCANCTFKDGGTMKCTVEAKSLDG